MKHIRLYIALIILACMALCCSITVNAFAASEVQVAMPITEQEGGPNDLTLYAYTVTITPPDGWYLNTASIQVEITGDAWAKVELQRPGVSAWEDVTGQVQSGSAKLDISANGTYLVRVTDPSGETHEAEQNVECIDSTPPTVWAGIRDKLLHTEASDTQSGISVATVMRFGLVGVAVGTLVGMSYQTVWMAWYNSKELAKLPFKDNL